MSAARRYGRRPAARETAPSVHEEFATLRADYEAARPNRYARTRPGIPASGAGADFHYRIEMDYLRMLETAREIDRNDQIVGQGISRAALNIVRDGLRLDPQTGDEDLDAALRERWDEWANDEDRCDKARELTFHEIEMKAIRHVIADGDVFFIASDDGSLEAVEAHRVRTPFGTKRNVVHGILLNEFRQRLEYWITKADVDPRHRVSRVRDISRVPARDPVTGNRIVFHVQDPKRLSQTRGVSAIVPIVDTTHVHSDLQYANLLKAQIQACVVILREKPADDFGDVDDEADRVGERVFDTLSDGTTRLTEGLSPGAEITSQNGEKLTGFSPDVPGADFFPHAQMIQRFMAVNLGIPLGLLLLDASDTNFSGWRGSMDQARLGFRRMQTNLAAKLHRPVYRWQVSRWIATDDVLRRMAESVADPFRHRWNPPTWPYIEPLKDAQADQTRIENGLTSPRRVHAERGAEYSEIVREIVEDNGALILAAKRRAEEINAAIDDGQRVHWREVISVIAALRPWLISGRGTAGVDAATTDGGQANGP